MVKHFHAYMDLLDTYWNITADAKQQAKLAIETTIGYSDEYWNEVKNEIERLPMYIEDIEQ